MARELYMPRHDKIYMHTIQMPFCHPLKFATICWMTKQCEQNINLQIISYHY